MDEKKIDSGLPKLLIFASGYGSNFESIVKAVEKKELAAEIAGLVCNRPTARALDVAMLHKISYFLVTSERLFREEHEHILLEKIKDVEYDWIILAGYMRIFSEEFINRHFDPTMKVAKIINIHPSLLPAFKGKNAYDHAFEYGVRVTGATIHFVTPGMDEGPIIAQKSFNICDKDSLDKVKKNGLKLENELYPKVINEVIKRRWTLKPRGQSSDGSKRMIVEFTEKQSW